MSNPSPMLTPTHPAAPAYRIDGTHLRKILTEAYEDSSGDTLDLRRRAVIILKDALEKGRAAALDRMDEQKGGFATAKDPATNDITHG